MTKKSKEKKFKVHEGDTIYYETPNGIEEDIAMMIDGHEITTSDYGYLNIKDCIPSDDPKVIEYLKTKDTGNIGDK